MFYSYSHVAVSGLLIIYQYGVNLYTAKNGVCIYNGCRCIYNKRI